MNYATEVRRGERQTGRTQTAVREVEASGAGLFIAPLSLQARWMNERFPQVKCVTPNQLPRLRGFLWKMVVIDNADYYDKESWTLIQDYVANAVADDGKVIEIREAQPC